MKSYDLIKEKDLIKMLKNISYARLAVVDVSAKNFEELIEKENEKINRYQNLYDFYKNQLENKFHLQAQNYYERHTSPFGVYHEIVSLNENIDEQKVLGYVNANPHAVYLGNNMLGISLRHIIEELIAYGEIEEFMKKYGDLEVNELKIKDKKQIESIELYDVVNDKISDKHPTIYLIHLEYKKEVDNGSIIGVAEHITRAISHQWVRHQSQAYQQQSQRYVKFSNKKPFYVLLPESIKSHPTSFSKYRNTIKEAYETYKYLVENNIKAEDARSVLPGDSSTTLVFGAYLKKTSSLPTAYEGIKEFIDKRAQKHAQWHIKEIANALKEMIISNGVARI